MPSSQLEDLAKLIGNKKQKNPYTVLLGSALSMTPSVLKELGYEKWDTFYEVTQRRSPSEWHSLLQEAFNTLHLQEGYRCLIQLLKAGYFDIVLSANLDLSLKHAIEQVGLSNSEGEVLVRGAHATPHIMSMLKRPQPRIKVCMLRGELDTTTSLTISESSQFDEQLATALKDYLIRDMIVLGASNRDTDIIRYIPDQGDSLWLVSSEPAPEQWKLLQRSHSGDTITGEEGDFNRFFAALVEQFGLQESKPTNEPTSASIDLAHQYQSSNRVDTNSNHSLTPVVEQPEQLDLCDDIAGNTTPINGTGKHWGVVVGITYHEDQSLQDQLETCEKDAEMFYQQLVCCSFHPERLHLLSGRHYVLPDKDAILFRLQTSAEATGPDDLLLFYYSGIVDEDDNEAYFIVSESLQSELQDTAIPVEQVKDILIGSPARAKVMLLDICYAATSSASENNKHSTEKFIQRIFTQAEGLTILATHKERHGQFKCSIFTYLLIEYLKRLYLSHNSGVISVPTLYHGLRESIKLYLSPASEKQNAIFCRYYKHDPDSYLISVYLYIVIAYNALKMAIKVFNTVKIISQDTCRHLHAILGQIDDPPPVEGTHYSQATLSLRDKQDKLRRRVNGLIFDIVTLRHRCEMQQTGRQALQQSILDDLKNALEEVEELINKLRREFISEEIDR